MNDLISRQDAIAKLKERRKIFCKNRLDFTILPDKDKARVNEIDACIAALMNLPPAEPELIEKEAYIRGFEQGRTQGMIDSQGGKK